MQGQPFAQDGLLHISLLGGQARALLMDSTALCESARRTHSLSRVATAALGRLLTATVMMGAMLKSDGDSVTAILKGGGPLGTLMAVAKPDGSVKGYVDNPDVDLPRRPDGKLPVGAAVGAQGDLTVIKDMGMREPYVGKTRLVSGEVAEDFCMYFAASEQTPSLVSLGVLIGGPLIHSASGLADAFSPPPCRSPGRRSAATPSLRLRAETKNRRANSLASSNQRPTRDRVLSAGGLIIQMLPGAGEAAIQSVELSGAMFSDMSKTMLEYRLEDSVFQLLGHLEPEIIERRDVRYLCDCSRERIERALISMGAKELMDMIREQRGAEVGCHFCNRKWTFTDDELAALLRAAGGES